MKSSNIIFNSQKFTNYMIGIFFITTCILILATDIFKKSENDLDLKNIYANPFTSVFLKTTGELQIKNRVGSFDFKNIDNEWMLLNPRALPANNRKIKAIIENLSKITIKRVFHKDQINLQNYSFNNPLAEVTLTSEISKIAMTIGLVNPINQSAYISFSNIDKIFQINLLPISFDSLTFTELIDTGIFSFETANVENIKIFQYGSSTPSFRIIKQGNLWIDDYKNKLDIDLVLQFITSLKALKSSYILDSVANETSTLITQSLAKPLYKIVIKELDQDEEVLIGNLSPKMEEIKVDKKTNVIVKSTKKTYPVILSKDFLYLFTQKQNALKQK